ncbi:MAG: winged helix-turn-helix domain-containing protein, partial [Usitatibacter sp.]
IADEGSKAGSELRVGEWRIDPKRNEVTRNGETARLEPKVIEVLVYLARKAGEVIAREELLSAVWPGVVVGDDALTQAIIKLRKALGDDAYRPKYIETISKRGYRLIAPVSPPAGSRSGAPPARAPARPRKTALLAVLGAGLAVALLALLASSELAGRLRWPIGEGDKAGAKAVSYPIIAILPLANQTGDPTRDYFSDGVTEDLINALGRFSGVRVVSRSSVEPYKGRAVTPQAIRKELGARYLVKGSVRGTDGKVRVAVELSDADAGTVLWSDRHDGEGKDVFDIQDRIVKNIVGALEVKVTRLEQERTASRHPDDLEAYDLVLRARALLMRSDRVADREARELLAKAVEKAPGYAEPNVLLGMAEIRRASFGWIEDPGEGLRRAEEHARRALATDDLGAHARAHGLLGEIYSSTGRYDQALVEVDRAIELNPSDAYAIDLRANTLLWQGRIEEAIAGIEMGLRFNPAGRGATTVYNYALAHYVAGRYREAVAIADAAIARFPDAAYVQVVRAAALAQMGNKEEARKAAAQVMRIDPFFKDTEFGNRFVDRRHTAHLQDGLRKAGL